MPHLRIYHVLVFGCLMTLLSPGCNSLKRTTDSDSLAPKLVVVISVDQMRYDYFERFDTLFTEGLKRLWDEGAVFTNARHVHAPTNTAPGHATLSTGSYPRHHGIVSNAVLDRATGEELYCVGDPDAQIIGVEQDGGLAGRSPRRLKRTTIGDWLKSASPGSKVYSVARKDRAAILLGGKKADRAFWFDNLSSKFVSSDYYGRKYPAWADSIVGKRIMADEIAEGWHKKLPEYAYASLRPDSFPQEAGAFSPDFPHTKDRMHPGYPERTKDLIMMIYTPMGDDLVLHFAKAISENEGLGTGAQTDMLLIGCSAADAVGHHFGPESHEVMDYYLWLDAYLGAFFDWLDHRIGHDAYWVVLSADHGVIPMPEAMQLRGIDARRVTEDEASDAIHQVDSSMMERFGLSRSVIAGWSDGVFIDYTESDSLGIKRVAMRNALAALLRTVDFIADAYTVDDLMGDTDRPYIRYYRNSCIPESGADVVVRLKENVLQHGPTGTSHASPYDYDSHVPIVFWGAPFSAARYPRQVETVDMAPTIAALLGIKTGAVDGEVLVEVVALP